MTGNAELFNMLMAKYRLNDPLSQEQQKFIFKSRKKILKAILKKYKKYSIIIWLVILTAMAFRSLGIKLTFIQSRIILSLALAASITGTSAGAYTGAEYIHKKLGYVLHIDRKVTIHELFINLRVDETTPVPETDEVYRTVTVEPIEVKVKTVEKITETRAEKPVTVSTETGSTTDRSGSPEKSPANEKPKDTVPAVPSMF